MATDLATLRLQDSNGTLKTAEGRRDIAVLRAIGLLMGTLDRDALVDYVAAAIRVAKQGGWRDPVTETDRWYAENVIDRFKGGS